MEKIIVSRCRDTTALILACGVVPPDVRVFKNVTDEDLYDRHVYGMLPFDLACYCDRYTPIFKGATKDDVLNAKAYVIRPA